MSNTFDEHSMNGPSRRTLAKGLAWSMPVIAVSSAAPAFAVSPCDGACYTYLFDQHAVGTSANGLTGTAKSAVCFRDTTVRTTLDMTGKAGSTRPDAIVPSDGLYSRDFNGKIDYRGEQIGNYPANAYQIAGLSATSPGLVLNIGHNTTTTVKFTFPVPVRSASLKIIDITRVDNSTSNYNYTDTVTIDQPWAMSSATPYNMTFANRASGGAGIWFNRTKTLASSKTSKVENLMSTTSTAPFSTLSFSYTAPASSGWQFIALTELHFCLA